MTEMGPAALIRSRCLFGSQLGTFRPLACSEYYSEFKHKTRGISLSKVYSQDVFWDVESQEGDYVRCEQRE